MTKKSGPVLIEVGGEASKITPATAPVVPDITDINPRGKAMQSLAAIASRRPSRLVRFFWQALVALISFAASLAAYDFVTGLIARSPILGGIALVLTGLFILALLLIAGKEWLAIGRLKRIDIYRTDADAALNNSDLKSARLVTEKVASLYANRPELKQGYNAFATMKGDAFDADALIAIAERELLAPLDEAARSEVEAAARQVATVTAIVPLALADLAAALTSNLRMIRRIAEIYGGRSGAIGSWRLTRAVFSHLVATGAVAIGDDLIGSIAGGGILSKLSRRFGEGMINGALTARVGVAAIEVCRPLPFVEQKPPSVTGIIKRALVGLIPGQNT
jgi:putative membrane protein